MTTKQKIPPKYEMEIRGLINDGKTRSEIHNYLVDTYGLDTSISSTKRLCRRLQNETKQANAAVIQAAAEEQLGNAVGIVDQTIKDYQKKLIALQIQGDMKEYNFFAKELKHWVKMSLDLASQGTAPEDSSDDDEAIDELTEKLTGYRPRHEGDFAN